MSKTYKGDVTGNVVELNLLDANEGTLPNLGTPTIITKNTGPRVIEQVVGDIPDYAVGSSPYYNDLTLKGLVIGTSCTSIGSYSFTSCGITSLSIPESVTSIGYYAFGLCSALAGQFKTPALVIPDSVTSIGAYAFINCSNINGPITIGNSVASIGDYCFYGCLNITSPLVIPDSVTSIGSYAFSGCSSLSDIYVDCPASSWVGTQALVGANINVMYVNDVVALGYTAGTQTFQGESLTIANWDNYPNPIPN